MAFDATYDACVLHPAGLRDLLVRLATTGMFRAHWSADILDEMVRSILRRRPDLTEAQLARTRQLMCDAVPDCLTTGYEELIDGLHLPDPDDRHVLAAAIRSGSQVTVTENLSDFPAHVSRHTTSKPKPPTCSSSTSSTSHRGPSSASWKRRPRLFGTLPWTSTSCSITSPSPGFLVRSLRCEPNESPTVPCRSTT